MSVVQFCTSLPEVRMCVLTYVRTHHLLKRWSYWHVSFGNSFKDSIFADEGLPGLKPRKFSGRLAPITESVQQSEPDKLLFFPHLFFVERRPSPRNSTVEFWPQVSPQEDAGR